MTTSEQTDAEPTAENTPESVAAPKAAKLSRRTGRRRLRLGIQSQILIMMLVASILGVAVIGLIGAVSGRNALREVESERLVELRESQKRAVQALFREVSNSVITWSGGIGINEATTMLTSAFAQLDNATITPAQQQSLVTYYDNEMIKPIKRITDGTLDIKAVLPSSNAQKYVQAYYTAAPRPAPGTFPVAEAGDGSAWSGINARLDYYMRGIVSRFDYQDALLLDLQGNVVYSVMKGPDLGTNILTGPYRESKLREAYQKALASNDLDFVWTTDFQPYQPQLDTPTAWVVSPVGMNGKFAGVMALPVPVAKINKIMTADNNWALGMGPGTETYLAGPDDLMRSDSRVFLENPKQYRRDVINAGTSPEVADRAIRLGGTTLVQPVATAGLRAAQRGETGVISATDYTGNRELEAYAPINIPNSDLHWSVLATRDDSAAFARLGRFSKTLVIAVTAMVFAICVASMLLAHAAVRPVRRLEEGARKISAGDYDVNIPVRTRDEFGDLTAAFNEMSRNLAIKEELLNEQRRENDRLLLALMPEAIVQRYRDGGEETVAIKHQDVAIIYADIVGLDEISNDLPEAELVGTVNELFRQFDSAAESLGVERIRTFHNGYLASCGVVTPRLDSIHRAVDFALEIGRIIDRFNNQNSHQLGLRVGVNTGNVVSGLVGRSSLVYDMWGGAVSLAYQMHSGAAQAGIYVSSQVYEALRDVRQFTAAGTISVDGTDQTIYRLLER